MQTHINASVIIVNWNGKAHLPDCLETLKNQTFKDFETIMVDNASSDGSLEFVSEHYPWVKTIALPFNQGFAGGNNAGYRHSLGNYIITLNNDTKTEPTWLEELIGVAEEHPGVGMVASRICSYDDHDVIDSLGVKVCSDGMSRGAFRLQRYSDLALGKNEEILMPSACAALYRRRMIETVGFFDEDFFAYCEDTDLGMRGRLAGYRAMLARDAVVYHKYSQAGGAFSPFKLYLVERNHYWVAVKTYPLTRMITLPITTLWRYLEQGRMVLASRGTGRQFAMSSSKATYISAIIRGMVDAIKMLPRMLAKRKKTAEIKILSDLELNQLLHAYRLSFKELLDAS